MKMLHNCQMDEIIRSWFLTNPPQPLSTSIFSNWNLHAFPSLIFFLKHFTHSFYKAMKWTKLYDVARRSYLHYWRYHCWNKWASGVSFAGVLGRIKKKWFDPLFLDQYTLSCELKSKFNKSNKIQGSIRNNHKNGYWMHGGKCISQFIQALPWFENWKCDFYMGSGKENVPSCSLMCPLYHRRCPFYQAIVPLSYIKFMTHHTLLPATAEV